MSFGTLKISLLFIYITQCTSNKRLLPNPGFDNPDAWESGYLPCALEDVVFPEAYGAILPLPTKVDVRGFLLPRDGAILLSDESTITLGGEQQQRDCENGRNRRAYLKAPTTRKWYDPNSWVSPAALAQNPAIPHLERVPCDNETVVIQRDGPLSIDLENTAYVRMGHLYLAGSLIASNYLNYLIHTDIGQLLFKNSLDTIAQYYHQDTCGCQMDALAFIEPICKHVMENCERPHCLVPVTPLESCCPICGSVLRFAMDYCSEASMNKLGKLIATAIKEQDLVSDLNYHINYVNTPPYGNYLEAIIIDRDGYNEKSVHFVNRLNASTNWSKLFMGSHKLEMIVSGRPYNPNITFGSVLLIIICMMLVSVVALVIFAHYSPDHRYLRRVPQWVYDPRRWRAFLLRSSAHFARFDNLTAAVAEVDVTDGITMGYDAESGQVRERAFDNPMFVEKRKAPSEINTGSTSTGSTMAVAASSTTGGSAAATVSISTVKEQKLTKKSSGGNKLESVTLIDAMENDDVEDEQELTEITLDDKFNVDSDEEEETKE
ncbi:protein amnionless [Eurosta solidaginis]|uniref:protein amnionless n=1 Tax=Eurosta solidaginis TaxID=178769 RepID=UPI003530C160